MIMILPKMQLERIFWNTILNATRRRTGTKFAMKGLVLMLRMLEFHRMNPTGLKINPNNNMAFAHGLGTMIRLDQERGRRGEKKQHPR